MNKVTLIGVLAALTFLFTFEATAGGKVSYSRTKYKENNNFCKNIKKELHKIISKGNNPDFPIFEIEKYYLWPSQHEGGVDMYKIDVDKDGELDTITLGCSSSVAAPSDPCLLTTITSATGNQFDLSGWNIHLMKIESRYFVLAHHDDEARYKLFTEPSNKNEGYIYHPEVAASIKYQLYEFRPTGLKLTCKSI